MACHACLVQSSSFEQAPAKVLFITGSFQQVPRKQAFVSCERPPQLCSLLCLVSRLTGFTFAGGVDKVKCTSRVATATVGSQGPRHLPSSCSIGARSELSLGLFRRLLDACIWQALTGARWRRIGSWPRRCTLPPFFHLRIGYVSRVENLGITSPPELRRFQPLRAPSPSTRATISDLTYLASSRTCGRV